MIILLAVSSFSAFACDYTSLIDKLTAQHNQTSGETKERTIGVTLLDWSEGVKAIFDVHWKRKTGSVDALVAKTTYSVDLKGELCVLKKMESMQKNSSSHSCHLEGIKKRLFDQHNQNLQDMTDKTTDVKVTKWEPGVGGKIEVSWSRKAFNLEPIQTKTLYQVKVDGIFCSETKI